MRKLRRNRNKRQVRLVLGVAFCLLCVMTVGYAAFSTNISLNAKGNIIKRQITTPDLLKEQVVTEGDGLYKDTTESGRYVYKGAAPNNYIKLDNDLYRIIAIESDNTLKVVKQDSLGNMVYDPSYSTTITGITSASSIEGTRYSSTSTDYCYQNSGTASSYSGCKMWGSAATMLDESGNHITKISSQIGGITALRNLPESEAYINVYLNGGTYQGISINGWYNTLSETVKVKVDTEHLWNVGLLKNTSGQTLETDLQQEQAYKWKGKVGLINPTDYVKANTNTSLCGNVNNNSTNMDICKTTWLFNSAHQWTISPEMDTTNGVWAVYSSGSVGAASTINTFGVRPVLYLTSDIQLDGSGTETDPYTIS